MRSIDNAVRRVRLLCAGLAATALLGQGPALAQDYGDTPYVQTPQNVVEKMLEIAKVGLGDYVIDLGSGDGRMVITAAKKHGARGFGVDLDRELVRLANRRAAEAGVADRAVFYQRDLYQTDVSRATVITIYLLPEVNLMVRPKLLAQLKPGTRIVSHDYDMGEWPPDLALVMDAPDKPVGADKKSRVFYWVVPAKASGRWRGALPASGKSQEFELVLEQMFQNLTGTLASAGQSAKIEEGKLNGTHIRFAARLGDGASSARYEFSGRIANGRIRGEVQVVDGSGMRKTPWSAVRTEFVEPAHTALKPPSPPSIPW
jgi:hypothetical protein